jgi:triosephosphate isomerase (TIM)
MIFKIIGNWKMYPKSRSKALQLINQIQKALIPIVGYEVAICPPAIFIPEIYQEIKLTSIKLGVQNIHSRSCGSFTGDISAPMVKPYCKYAIIGHSERRAECQEDDKLVNEKILTALEYDLSPIVCVGETLEDYRSGQSDLVVEHLKKCLKNVNHKQIERVLIAYEPIWAIGTKNPADADYANQIISLIRQGIAASYNRELAYRVGLLYGGSVDSGNIAHYISQPEINGVLIGQASSQASEFIKICQVAKK